MGNNTEIKAVISDIDGTLWPGISWHKLSEEFYGDFSAHQEIYGSFRKGELDYSSAREKILSLWLHSGDKHKDHFVKLFQGLPLREGARDIFDYFRLRGYRVCLISGAVDLFVQIIAERLGVEDWYAGAILHWDKNGNVISFDWIPEQSEHKRRQLLEFCAKSDVQPQECAVIGDDWNDVGLFKLTGRGIVVQSPTSSDLESYAWKKVGNLREIKDIL